MWKTKRIEDLVINDNYDSFDFEKFFDLSPDLLCVAGYDGYLKKINPAVSKLLGYTNEELLSKPINDFVYFADQKSTSTARNDLERRCLYLILRTVMLLKMVLSFLLWTSLPIDSDKVVYAIAKNITYKKELEEERNIHLAELTKSTTNSSSSPIQLLTISNLLLIYLLLNF
jgi:PAS domain S-box-containing protein